MAWSLETVGKMVLVLLVVVLLGFLVTQQFGTANQNFKSCSFSGGECVSGTSCPSGRSPIILTKDGSSACDRSEGGIGICCQRDIFASELAAGK